MKASDIVVDCWLSSKSQTNKFIFKVEQVTKKKVGYHIRPNEYKMHYLRLVECEPISLTQEILEKNGFVVESRYCHGNPLQYCVLVDGLWIDISGENYFEGKLEYVHQLQNALRVCGIEKEIEL